MESSDTSQRVTWLLPVKNGLPYLARTLESIEQQTFRNFEIIAWDNGSTDGSAELLRHWVPHRITGRVVTDRPMGLGASLAAMVAMAQTPLCARIDADDINEPHRLENQVRLLREQPRVAVVGSAMTLINGLGTAVAGQRDVATDDAELRWRLRFWNPMCHPTVVFRRDAVLAAGNYRDRMPVEDLDLWIRVALRSELANIAEPLVRYRVHGQSVSAAHQQQIDSLRRDLLMEHAKDLFAGLGTEEIARLYLILNEDTLLKLTRHDRALLSRAAIAAATAAGCDRNYFKHTELYQRQSRDLSIRWLKSKPMVARVWAKLRREAA